MATKWEPCKLDIEGPAFLIVPISENEYDRWAFNDLVDHFIGHNVTTQEELDLIIEKWDVFYECMEEHFSTKMVEPNRENLREFHKEIIAKMET